MTISVAAATKIVRKCLCVYERKRTKKGKCQRYRLRSFCGKAHGFSLVSDLVNTISLKAFLKRSNLDGFTDTSNYSRPRRLSFHICKTLCKVTQCSSISQECTTPEIFSQFKEACLLKHNHNYYRHMHCRERLIFIQNIVEPVVRFPKTELQQYKSVF